MITVHATKFRQDLWGFLEKTKQQGAIVINRRGSDEVFILAYMPKPTAEEIQAYIDHPEGIV